MLLLLCFVSAPFTGEVFNLGLGARALGMGGAYTALATDASGVFWNPAGLGSAAGTQMVAMHGSYLQGLNYEFASLSRENLLGSATGGLGVFFLNAGGIPITQLEDTTLPPSEDNPPVLEGTTSYRAFQGLFSMAWKNGFGFSLKTLFQQADTVSAYGIGLDIAYFKRLNDNMSMGLNLKDVSTTPIFWSTGTHESITPSLNFGLAVDAASWLTLSADAVARFDERPQGSEAFTMGVFSLEPKLGTELLMGPARFRLGAQSGVATVGAGFQTSWFSADYALYSHPDLGAAHRFSITMVWARQVPAVGEPGN